MTVSLTYFINTLDWGGAQTGMKRLVSGLADEDFEVTVVCFRIDDEAFLSELPDYVEIVSLDIDSKSQIHRLWPLFWTFSETDVLVCSIYHSSIVGTILGSILRVPAIFRWQHSTNFKNGWRKPIHRITASLSNVVLADSEESNQFLRSELGLRSDAIRTVRLAGIDSDTFLPKESHTRECLKVGTVGRLQEVKNFDLVIQLAQSLPSDRFQFYIVGDGPSRPELERQAASVKSASLLGELEHSEIADFMRDLDVYVQPSFSEGLCITVLEAMACELPVIASPVGGISNSVAEGESGYLVEPDDIDGYIERLTTLAEDPHLREAMGIAGRKRVINHYSQEALIERFREVVEGELEMDCDSDGKY